MSQSRERYRPGSGPGHPGEVPEHNRAAVLGGFQGGLRRPRPLTRPSHPGGGFPTSGRDLSPLGLAVLVVEGVLGDSTDPSPTRLSRERTERKAGAERPASRRHPRLLPSPDARRPRWGDPQPGAPAALGLQRAARGRGPGRRSVLTGTDILAAAPGARAGSSAGRLRAPVCRAAQSPPRGVPALSGLPTG